MARQPIKGLLSSMLIAGLLIDPTISTAFSQVNTVSFRLPSHSLFQIQALSAPIIGTGGSEPLADPLDRIVVDDGLSGPTEVLTLDGINHFKPQTIILYGLGSLPERFLAGGFLPLQSQFPNVRFIAVDAIDPGREYARRDDPTQKIQGEDLIKQRMTAIGLPWREGINYFTAGEGFDRLINDSFDSAKGTLMIGGEAVPIGGVIAAVPTVSHFPIAELWASKGVPVWVEKPVVLPHQVDSILALDQAYPGKIFSVDFFQDSDSITGLLNDAERSKWIYQIGPIERVEGRLVESWPIEAGREALMNPLISGGGLGMDVVVHVLALIEMLLNENRASLADAHVVEAIKARYLDPKGTPTPGAPTIETYLWMKLSVMLAGREIEILADGGKGTDDHYYGVTITGKRGRIEIFTGTEKAEPYVKLTMFDELGGRAQEHVHTFKGGGVGYKGIWHNFLLQVYGEKKTTGLSLAQRLRATTQSVRLIAEAYRLAGDNITTHELGKTPVLLSDEKRVLGGKNQPYYFEPLFRGSPRPLHLERQYIESETSVDAIGKPLEPGDDGREPKMFSNRYGSPFEFQSLEQQWEPEKSRKGTATLSAPYVLMKNMDEISGDRTQGLDLRDTPTTTDGQSFKVYVHMGGQYRIISVRQDAAGQWIGGKVLVTNPQMNFTGPIYISDAAGKKNYGYGELTQSPVETPDGRLLLYVSQYHPPTPIRMENFARFAVLSVPYDAAKDEVDFTRMTVLFQDGMRVNGWEEPLRLAGGAVPSHDGRFLYLPTNNFGGTLVAFRYDGTKHQLFPQRPKIVLRPDDRALRETVKPFSWKEHQMRFSISSDDRRLALPVLIRRKAGILVLSRDPLSGELLRNPGNQDLREPVLAALNGHHLVPGDAKSGKWNLEMGWSPEFIPARDSGDPDALMVLSLNPVDYEDVQGVKAENVVVWSPPMANVHPSEEPPQNPNRGPRNGFAISVIENSWLPTGWADMARLLVDSAEIEFEVVGHAVREVLDFPRRGSPVDRDASRKQSGRFA
jgi:predicted dehydrogenase